MRTHLRVGKLLVRRDASCEESFRVGKHLVRRDTSCEESFRVGTPCEERRFM